MQTLSRELRRELERTVKQARRVAEAGARKAIERLGVGDAKPPTGLSPAGQSLRDRLRAHGRQLGDRREVRTGKQVTTRLVAECAYENWHRMLFARFLAENELLIEPEHAVPISLDDCKELARSQAEDWLALASSYAVRMLPQIFRPNDPVLDVSLPPETRSELEDLLKGLPDGVFKADDSLGWVYQFWQAERKEEVNASEKKIGADELPAVTQLFTEDYMVLYLLHNTLGAWWAGKVMAARPELAMSAASEDELRAACAVGNVAWTYLRFVREGEGPWRPAAGNFKGWPKSAREITVLDPCMGSGHFLVFALQILADMRMEEEGLSRELAVDAVLRDNLFGLEIDPRCTQIAAFNLALSAWRSAGYRPLPPLQLACSGLALGVTKEEWLSLAEKISSLPPEKDLFGTTHNLFSQQVQGGLDAIYNRFEKAPWLGSLIDPRRVRSSLLEAGYSQLEPLISPLLASQVSAEISEMAVTAQGLAKTAELLASQYTLVMTNVPYLGQGKHDEVLKSHSETQYPDGKADLATVFLLRCVDFCSDGGSVSLVTPQNWLFLTSYAGLRESLLARRSWDFVARLGDQAFQTISGGVVRVVLLGISRTLPQPDRSFVGWDVMNADTPEEKDVALRDSAGKIVSQESQLRNPDARVTFDAPSDVNLLSDVAESLHGQGCFDSPCFSFCFWELPMLANGWVPQQSSPTGDGDFTGCTAILRWEDGRGMISDLMAAKAQSGYTTGKWRAGVQIWGRGGVVVSLMRKIVAGIYCGYSFDDNVAVVTPSDDSLLLPIYAFCKSPLFESMVRTIDQKLNVPCNTLAKVPFDLAHWQGVAAEKYANGLPEPESDDPTQWLYHGRPEESNMPLQVAVARLVGYRWPAELDVDMHLSDRARDLVRRCDVLLSHVDNDGIVCLDSIKGEASGAERINGLLAAAFGTAWSAGKLDSLMVSLGFSGKTLDDWLRDGFFENHCAVFHQRPFIWHIWDGRHDGFHALVNYHRLAAPDGEGRRTLEKLIYSYLGDWIVRQRNEQANGVDGADARLAAAGHLKSELEKILAGEPPYDIFVRWKPLPEQPIGWEPDINDGVRVNIRPFMSARPLSARAKGACILRITPRIKWEKDRGKEPDRPKDEYPWFWGWDEQTQDFKGGSKFDGNRWNGLHYSNAVKQAARERAAAEAQTEEHEA